MPFLGLSPLSLSRPLCLTEHHVIIHIIGVFFQFLNLEFDAIKPPILFQSYMLCYLFLMLFSPLVLQSQIIIPLIRVPGNKRALWHNVISALWHNDISALWHNDIQCHSEWHLWCHPPYFLSSSVWIRVASENVKSNYVITPQQVR